MGRNLPDGVRGGDPRSVDAIPDLYISRIHNEDDPDCDVHYETFGRLAEIFGRNTPPHRHSRHVQLHVLVRGRVRLQLDEALHDGEAPLLYLTPAGLPHAFYSDDATQGHVITIRQETVRQWLASMPGEWSEATWREPAFMLLGGAQATGNRAARVLLTLCDLLAEEFSGQSPGRAAAVSALGLNLVIEVQRLLAQRGPVPATASARREDLRIFLAFCDLVEAHFHAHWTLTEYARHLSVTESRLNDVSRRSAGLSSKEVVHERLLQEAKRLLRFSDEPVSALGYRLGFADPAYFSRFFGRRAGMSPSAFRERFRSAP